MGAVESQLITDLIASPRVLATVREKHGRMRVDVCRVTIPATPGAGWLLRLTKLRAHDHLLSVRQIGDADANMSDCNLGIYTPSDSVTDPVVVGSANSLIEAANLSAIDEWPTEILGDGLTQPENFGKALWVYAGVSTEPAIGTEYEIVMEIVSDAAGSDHCFIIGYLAGD